MTMSERSAIRKRIIEKLVRKVGLRPKIDAFCVECIYDPYSKGTWRKQTMDCTSACCPLYTVRPKVTSGEDA
jgi:hypothetical protein